MKYYFGNSSNFSLDLFGPVHILAILITCILIICIYKYKTSLQRFSFLKYVIIFILFGNMAIYTLGALLTGNYDINIHLPIHYCYITGFLFMYMLLKNKRNWFNFLYYAIFFCTLTVIIFQDPYITYDRYEFILLLISHHFLLVSNFFVLNVLDYKVNKNGYKYFIIYSIIVYLIVFLINQVLNTDYIFNTSFPLFIYEYFPFINVMPPIFWLFLVSVPLLYLAYIPIKYKNNSKDLEVM